MFLLPVTGSCRSVLLIEKTPILNLMKKILGLIPARGGSKSIPLKNIYPIAGKPLMAYTCRSALESSVISRVIVSTDHEEIASIGQQCGVEVPFMRPFELARDDSPSIDVALHALHWLKSEEGWVPDILVLLQPTSPLRRAEHIDQAVELLQKEQIDTVVSVVKVPHNFSPYSIQKIENDLLKDFWGEPLPFDRYRRQNFPTLYARNGPAILAARVPVLIQFKSFYGNRVKPYIMLERDSIDVDNRFDLKMAEWVLGELEDRL